MFSRQLLGERSVFRTERPESVGAVRFAARAPFTAKRREVGSAMTESDVLLGYRLQLFALAAERGVSEACRLMGVHRCTDYRCKREVDRQGLEMLRPRERRRPVMPNQLSLLVEQRIVGFAARASRARAAADRLGAGAATVGRTPGQPQRRLYGAASPRPEHARAALGAGGRSSRPV